MLTNNTYRKSLWAGIKDYQDVTKKCYLRIKHSMSMPFKHPKPQSLLKKLVSSSKSVKTNLSPNDSSTTLNVTPPSYKTKRKPKKTKPDYEARVAATLSK